jgi:hypothetical protein
MKGLAVGSCDGLIVGTWVGRGVGKEDGGAVVVGDAVGFGHSVASYAVQKGIVAWQVVAPQHEYVPPAHAAQFEPSKC